MKIENRQTKHISEGCVQNINNGIISQKIYLNLINCLYNISSDITLLSSEDGHAPETKLCVVFKQLPLKVSYILYFTLHVVLSDPCSVDIFSRPHQTRSTSYSDSAAVAGMLPLMITAAPLAQQLKLTESDETWHPTAKHCCSRVSESLYWVKSISSQPVRWSSQLQSGYLCKSSCRPLGQGCRDKQRNRVSVQQQLRLDNRGLWW